METREPPEADMTNAKQRVRELLDRLPDDCTLEEIQYHLYVIQQIELGLAQDLFVTIPRRQYKALKARTEVNPRLMAPLAKGAEVGKLVVELEGEIITETPLISLQGSPEGGLWRQASDSARLWFE